MTSRFGRASLLPLLASGLACDPAPPAAPPASVTVSVPYELDTLDPHARDLVGQHALNLAFYEPLVAKDARLSLRPALAERWISPDPQTWVFSLRPGVRFHDGRPLTSADVVATFERLRAQPELQAGVYAQDVVSARATGPLTVELRASGPAPVLLNRLAAVMIVPAGSSAEGLARQPVGTGPYRLVSWQPGERIELRRHEGYWGRPAALERVSYQLDRSDAEALDDVAAGRSQVALLATRAAQALAESQPGLRLLRQPGVSLKYLGFDLERPVTPGVSPRGNPFRDLRVRQAFDLALDRPRLVGRLPTFAVPAGQLVPPLIFGFNPALPAPAHDPARARELLSAAGYARGFEATLQARELAGPAAGLVREQLAEVGLRVTVQTLGEREFFRAASAGPSLFLTRYGCDSGDAGDVLNAGLHSPDPARRLGSANYGRYSNPALDALIEEGGGAPDQEAHRERLQAAVALAARELPWIPLYFDEDVYLVRAPYTLSPRADGYLLPSDVGLAPGRR